MAGLVLVVSGTAACTYLVCVLAYTLLTCGLPLRKTRWFLLTVVSRGLSVPWYATTLGDWDRRAYSLVCAEALPMGCSRIEVVSHGCYAAGCTWL